MAQYVMSLDLENHKQMIRELKHQVSNVEFTEQNIQPLQPLIHLFSALSKQNINYVLIYQIFRQQIGIDIDYYSFISFFIKHKLPDKISDSANSMAQYLRLLYAIPNASQDVIETANTNTVAQGYISFGLTEDMLKDPITPTENDSLAKEQPKEKAEDTPAEAPSSVEDTGMLNAREKEFLAALNELDIEIRTLPTSDGDQPAKVSETANIVPDTSARSVPQQKRKGTKLVEQEEFPKRQKMLSEVDSPGEAEQQDISTSNQVLVEDQKLLHFIYGLSEEEVLRVAGELPAQQQDISTPDSTLSASPQSQLRPQQMPGSDPT